MNSLKEYGIADPEQEQAVTLLAERLAARVFNPDKPPKPAKPRFFCNGVPICTPGNLTSIFALPKDGKTAVVGAMLSATIASGRDCLGFSAERESGAVLHLDTEQSEADHWDLMQRVLRRAGVAKLPPWLLSHYLTGFSVPDLREGLKWLMREALDNAGGVHSVIIDGGADLVANINDPDESNGFIAELHGQAIEYHCPIILVIHLNPNGEKTRGHFGSQLERKAETNLRLEKDGDITTVWASKNRRAPIAKEYGPRFQWSTEADMHVSVANQATAKAEVERAELTELAQTIFESRPAMPRADLESTVKTHLTVSKKTSERRVTRMTELGIVRKDFAGLYILRS